jgi:hypothetical protein
LHHNVALLGGSQDFVVLGLPIGAGNGLGLSVLYQDDGTFEGRDAFGARTGDYGVRLYGASVGWGMRAPGGFSLGLAAKMNRQDTAGSTLDAVAGDVGLLWTAGPHLTLGAAYSNFGPDVAGAKLAQGLRVGASSHWGECTYLQWLFALSGESLTQGENSLHAGVEATLSQVLALRAGYSFDVPHSQNTGMVGWTAGAGLLLGRLSLDYAYQPLEALGSMQRISLTYTFGDRCQTTVPPPQAVPAAADAVQAPPPPMTNDTVAPPPPAADQAVLTLDGEAPLLLPLPAPAAMGSYTVLKGDSLWTIAEKDKVLGDSFRWPLLYKANRDQIQDPDLIEPSLALRFKAFYTVAEAEAAVQKAGDTPRYEPHVTPRANLPMKY